MRSMFFMPATVGSWRSEPRTDEITVRSGLQFVAHHCALPTTDAGSQPYASYSSLLMPMRSGFAGSTAGVVVGCEPVMPVESRSERKVFGELMVKVLPVAPKCEIGVCTYSRFRVPSALVTIGFA